MMRATSLDSSSAVVDAVIVDKDTQQAVNGSLCHVSSLEVYHGTSREHAYEIRNDGFSLNNDGNIEVSRCILYLKLGLTMLL